MVRARLITVGVIAALALTGYAAGTPASTAAPPPIPADAASRSPVSGIIVTGRGIVEAAPDRAIVTVGAQFTRATAQEAQEVTSMTMAQTLRQVMALGIPRERIQTVEIDLFPQRRPPAGEIVGYQAVQRARITLDDLTLVGRVLDAAVASGANLLDGVAFTVRDPGAARTRALAAAVQDARASADALAAAAGLGTPRIVRIEESGAVPIRGESLRAAPEAATPVLPGTLSLGAQVRVVFAF